MSEVRLVLRDAQREISGTCHGSLADRVVAALSAEPETIAELETAMGRFEQSAERTFFSSFQAGCVDEPYDAGLMVVDLAARLVAAESTYSSASREGAVGFHDGHSATDAWVHYHLPDDWQITEDVGNWRPLAEQRRRERLAQQPLDSREVLYGQPLLEFIAAECFRAFRGFPVAVAVEGKLVETDERPRWEGFDDEGQSRSDAEHSAVRDLHARWLVSPRSDLRDCAPRDVLLARKQSIDFDLQDRAFQWSAQGRCPRGLDPTSHAYRFAGFGTHEIVVYYDLVRWLIWSCRDRVAMVAETPQASLMTAGDFLAGEVARLTEVRDAWLDAPDPECHGRTPRSIVDRERRRLPESLSPEEAIVDDDCPLCQMVADGLSGPGFWHLDGCNMDDDFAFSFHRTREEWEAEQRRHEEFNCRFNAEQAERERLGVKYPGEGYCDPDYVWERSFVGKPSEGMPLELRLFGFGSNLAELIVDLKQPTEDRPLIDQLNRDFGNLRDVARSDDPSRAAALAGPVVDRFCETLADVAAARDDLRPKCEDLRQRLQRFFEPPSERTDADADDGGIPF